MTKNLKIAYQDFFIDSDEIYEFVFVFESKIDPKVIYENFKNYSDNIITFDEPSFCLTLKIINYLGKFNLTMFYYYCTNNEIELSIYPNELYTEKDFEKTIEVIKAAGIKYGVRSLTLHPVYDRGYLILDLLENKKEPQVRDSF